MKKIVINRRHGGFGLSAAAIHMYADLAKITLVRQESYAYQVYYVDSISDDNYFDEWSIPRDCPHLVQTVESLGVLAGSTFSELKVVEIPDDVQWQISEYDGVEWVAEKHRVWS
jgi:hypothetical protein